MKKLIIAAAIVCAAAMSQAAAVVWSAGATSDEKGYSVYILTALGTFANEAAVSNASIGSGVVSGSRSVSAEGIATGAALTKSTTTLYAVVVTDDGKKYATTSFSPSGYVYDDKAQPPEPSPGTVEFSVSGLTYKAFAVPEPTSGLLLLLGVAGMALRRRRA